MRITVGDFRAEDRTCRVTFTEGEVRHRRSINAVVGADGVYDKVATRERAVEVGRGVAAKIVLGVILPDVDV